LIQQQPDATLAELRDRLGVPCCIATIARTLKRLRITRKKKTLHAQEGDTSRVQRQRAAFDRKMAQVDVGHLIFVDETGTTTAMTRRYGRAAAGQRVKQSAPGKWQTLTLIAAMSPTEVMAPFVFSGSTDTLAFQTYVEEVLVPEVRPGDVVVWDNLKPHQNGQVREALAAVGARVEPLPPWSPDKNPIEEMFGKVKEYLRSVAARSTEAVIDAIAEGLRRITPDDIRGWFNDRCAYAMH
jgi:transposase